MSNENKHHYTYFSRFTHGKAINLTHKYGAKMHINEVRLEKEKFEELVDEEIDD